MKKTVQLLILKKEKEVNPLLEKLRKIENKFNQVLKSVISGEI